MTAEEIYARYLDVVFGYVSRRVPRREEAEDVTAEVFTVLFQAPRRRRGDRHLYLWLLGVARRKIADALRRRKSRRESLVSELADPHGGSEQGSGGTEIGVDVLAITTETPETAALRAERSQRVRELIESLNPDQREALLLKYVEGLSTAEIALLMKRSPAAVNSLLQRARSTLFQRGQTYFLMDG